MVFPQSGLLSVARFRGQFYRARLPRNPHRVEAAPHRRNVRQTTPKCRRHRQRSGPRRPRRYVRRNHPHGCPQPQPRHPQSHAHSHPRRRQHSPPRPRGNPPPRFQPNLQRALHPGRPSLPPSPLCLRNVQRCSPPTPLPFLKFMGVAPLVLSEAEGPAVFRVRFFLFSLPASFVFVGAGLARPALGCSLECRGLTPPSCPFLPSMEPLTRGLKSKLASVN